jgi:hypothetical protein
MTSAWGELPAVSSAKVESPRGDFGETGIFANWWRNNVATWREDWRKRDSIEKLQAIEGIN